MFGEGGPEEGIRIFYAGFFYHGQRYREFEREYFDDFHARDERLPRLRQLPDSQLIHVRDLYTDEELKTSATYNDALLRAHTQNGINVRLDGPNGSRIVWGPEIVPTLSTTTKYVVAAARAMPRVVNA